MSERTFMQHWDCPITGSENRTRRFRTSLGRVVPTWCTCRGGGYHDIEVRDDRQLSKTEARELENLRRLARYDEAISLLRDAVPFLGGWTGYEKRVEKIEAFLAAEPKEPA